MLPRDTPEVDTFDIDKKGSDDLDICCGGKEASPGDDKGVTKSDKWRFLGGDSWFRLDKVDEIVDIVTGA